MTEWTWLDRGLAEARAAAEGLVDPAPLDRAREVLRAPTTVLVVGRRGVGKSALVGWLSGVPQPTGLGGVTRETTVVDGADERFLDTPGIDDPDEAVLTSGPLAADADAVIWVTDGLQPWTSTERALYGQLHDPLLPLVRVVSRADLVEPAERDEVTARLRALADAPVWWADLRALARSGGPRPELLRFPSPGPRRRARLRALLAEVAPPVVPTREDVRRWFRDAARDALASVVHDVGTDAIRSSRALAGALAAAHESVLAELRPRVPVPLPTVPPPPPCRLDRRALRAAAADWVAGGELVLAEQWPEARTLDDLRARASALAQALDAVRSAL
jgi:hypothetical protein